MTTNEMQQVDFILPSTAESASLTGLRLCELFIDKLLSSTCKEFVLSVDHKNKAIYSNDVGVKEAVNLIYKSGRLEAFYEQLGAVLHMEGEQKVLRLKAEEEIRFVVVEESTLPNLSLKITLN